MPAKSVLTTGDVAGLLRVHPKHIYRLIRRGLPARRMGGLWRFDRDEVLAWHEGAALEVAPIELATAASPRPSPSCPPLLAANGDVVVLALLDVLAAAGSPLGLVRTDRDGGHAMLAERGVLLSGSHGRQFPTLAGGARLARIHLCEREVGLCARRGAKVPKLAELAKLRVAYRPNTAAIVVHFESAARRARLDPKRLLARAELFASHEAVASAVARTRADVGLVTRGWADRMGLAFEPIATESYGLLVRAEELGDPRVVILCEVAQGELLRAALRDTPGYNLHDAGVIRYDLPQAH